MVLRWLPLLIGLVVLAWVYKTFCPPPPKICGTPGGPPVTGPRIKLRDGRYLSYLEEGVPKDTAKYKIIFIHSHSSNKYGNFLATSKLVEELVVYLVSFDKPGYGESDPDPKRTIKSTTLDIQELADQLELGTRFYVVGYSMGGILAWGCLKYMPHRLAGAALLSPPINYWWPSLPEDVTGDAFYHQSLENQISLRILHYTPWLDYWWRTQSWFPTTAAAEQSQFPKDFHKLHDDVNTEVYSTQQGLFESLCRDEMVGLGNSWEFDPVAEFQENPLLGTSQEGSSSVYMIYGGAETAISYPTLRRYIAQSLPWIHYHEVPNRGHPWPKDDGMSDSILKTILTGQNMTTTSYPTTI